MCLKESVTIWYGITVTYVCIVVYIGKHWRQDKGTYFATLLYNNNNKNNDSRKRYGWSK